MNGAAHHSSAASLAHFSNALLNLNIGFVHIPGPNIAVHTFHGTRALPFIPYPHSPSPPVLAQHKITLTNTMSNQWDGY